MIFASHQTRQTETAPPKAIALKLLATRLLFHYTQEEIKLVLEYWYPDFGSIKGKFKSENVQMGVGSILIEVLNE